MFRLYWGHRSFGIGVGLLIGVLSGCSNTGKDAEIVIDAERRYQQMAGWEVTARLWEYDKRENVYDDSWLSIREAAADLLVEEIGIDRLRLELRSGAENPVDYWREFAEREISYEEVKSRFYEKMNDNTDPLDANPAGFQFSHLDHQVQNILMPLKKKLADVNRPLRVSLCYVDFRWTKHKGDVVHATQPLEYAELVLQAFKHLKAKYDLVPDSFELVLEPDNSDSWRGRQIGEALVVLDERLSSEGFSPEFIAPSTAFASRTLPYLDAMLDVPGVADRLSAVSYHRYDLAGVGDGLLARIYSRAETLGLRTEMLEFTKGDYRTLYQDLTKSNASAWQIYMIAKPRRGAGASRSVLLDAEVYDDGQIELRLSDRARLVSQFTKHVRKGAIRVGAESNRGHAHPVAFHNPDGSIVLVIISDKPGKVSVVGPPSLEPEATFTSDLETAVAVSVEVDFSPVEIGEQRLSWELSQPGVVTLVFRPGRRDSESPLIRAPVSMRE